MPCPKDYLSKKATIDPVVQDYGFFNSKPVNEWTFEEYITGTNPENLEEVYLLLRQFKQSLQSLRRMRSLDRNLKSYIGNLKKRDYTKAELQGFLPQKNNKTNSSVTINMNKSTILSANGNSKVVINQANSKKRNRKERDEDGGDPTTNVFCEIDTNYTAKFMINNVDILPSWNQYKIHCQNNLSRGASTVETDIAKLLSQAHIMLLKRDAVDSDLQEMLGSGVVQEISNKVKECFGIEDEELFQETERGLRDAIKDAIDKKINSREASSKIMSFCSEKMNTPLDDVLHIIRNFIERIPQKKYNQQIQESDLSYTYVDALIRSLIECPDDNIFLIWSNLKVQDDCAERPDISGVALVDTQFKNIICVGEVKGEDKISDNHATLCDLIKIGCFSKEAIDTYSNYGILGIHVVGFQVTIYVTILLTEGLYVMQEICSIRLPTSIYDMKSFIANIDDLLPIKTVYKKCMKNHEKVLRYKKKGAAYKEMLQY